IGMAFMLSVWWLVQYYMDYGTLRKMPPTLLSSDGVGRAADSLGFSKTQISQGDDIPMALSGGAVSLGFSPTLGRMLFVPGPQTVRAVQKRAAELPAMTQDSRRFLAMLDQCNLVVLQLAFWVLGAGIICGAIWADQSWGRPWGWDPKETF